MVSQPFVHLHVHSTYSLLDGAVSIDDLVAEAVKQEMPALALTDHGVLFGAIEFYTKARKAGINPILGCEAYLVKGDATAEVPPGEKRKRHHVTLLATNRTGWQNLSRLSTLSWLKGFNRKPCLDKSMLAEHGEGLIALTGCMSGEVAQAILADDKDGAVKAAQAYAEVLGRENVYLEVMSNGMSAQQKIRDGMLDVAKATGLPLVATNDVHYRCPGGHVAQDALICIGTGQRMHEEVRRYKIDTEELFFRSSDEMAGIFGGDSVEYRSTLEIAQRCDIQLDLGTYHLPSFPIPTDETPEAYLRRLCEDGLARLYGEITPPIRERFEKEYGVITSMGFTAYFLIVWDLIRHAREQGIPVGPGRGSAAGSIIAYSLNITRLDPLRYDLLFERFLNADRISMPDIDIDFCRDRREEMIQYTRDKYGDDKVCQIVTFQQLQAKAAIRDAGRVLDVPLPDVDRIAKRIPEMAQKKKLQHFIDADPELKEMFEGSEQLEELLGVSQSIEGMARNTSTHAAGVVITDRPLIDLVPLCLVQGQVNTQFQMNDLERTGLLKMDFLGLKNLTILQKAAETVRAAGGPDIDYDELGLDDVKTYALLKRGDSGGVFQLESSGMRELLVRLAPDCFEDIIALIALYRPGPLQSGMADSFVNRKHGHEAIEYGHPLLEPVLRDTYGCMVYQEQIMLLAQTLGGLSLNDADGLRKAMGKKDAKRMDSYRGRFLEGASTNAVPAPVAEQVWEDMSRFAEYGFNKSHSAAYGLITYRTAYMKANYPGEYMAALMSCDANNVDKLAAYVEEALRSQREVLPPSVNHSRADFSLEGESIRFGLSAVRGVGSRVVRTIVEGREQADGRFADLGAFLDQVDVSALNRSSLDALVKGGAFDELAGNRHALLASTDRLLRDAVREQGDRAAGQSSLFGAGSPGAATVASIQLEKAEPPTDRDLAAMEKEALGVCLSVDPMGEYRPLLRLLGTHTVAELAGETPDRAEVVLGGLVTALRHTIAKNGRSAGKPMAMFKVAGLGGSVSAVIFPRTYEKCRDLIKEERLALFRAVVDKTRDEPSLLVDEVFDPADPSVAGNRRLILDLRRGEDDAAFAGRLRGLKALLPGHPGPTSTLLSIEEEPGRRTTYDLGERGRVGLGVDLVRDLERLLGPGRVYLR